MKKINLIDVRRAFLWMAIGVMSLGLSGCKYSFTGASISPEVQTVSVDFFQNNAPLAPPTLSQKFTEALKDIFISQTSLTLVAKNGDLHFEGYIKDYRAEPIAIQASQVAASNRLTITVAVRYTNSKDDTQDFESSFSRFQDYDASQPLTAVEDALIESVNNQLVQDVFNKSVGNW